MKKIIFIFIIISQIISCSTNTKQEVKKPPIKIAWALWSGWYPMAIAQELKLFEKYGVNIEPIFYESYTQIFPDLASKKIDAAFSGLYEILKSNISGMKVVLITDYSDGAEGIVISGNINKPEDIKGKKIGIQGQLSGSEFLLTTFLRKIGLSKADVITLDVSPEQVLNLMPSKIDGGYTWDPFLSEAKQKGHKTLFTTADMPGLVLDIVAFHGEIANERPDDIRNFIKAWFEAVEYWKKEPEKAKQLIMKVTKLKPEEITLTGCKQFFLQDNINAFNKNNKNYSIYEIAKQQIEFLVGIGDASNIPVFDSIIDGRFLTKSKK